MRDLKNTKDLVEQVLIDKPETRNSDDLLYVEVCKRINPRAVNLCFSEVMKYRKTYNFPAFESVRRTRQKLQADDKKLRGNSEVQNYREQLEEEYKAFAMGMM